jgi:AcrR family transcriptional regulator
MAPAERADAARNRQRVLAAAERLLERSTPEQVTMEQIARAAGVGKGTLYRRYPSLEAIAVALLDEHERALQERLLRGPPPLGPGAPPDQRLAAFYEAMVDLLERHGHLALAAETGVRRFGTGAYGFWRAHVAALVRVAGVGLEAEALADSLLAPLAPELYRYQRETRGLSQAEVARGLALLATRVLGATAPIER